MSKSLAVLIALVGLLSITALVVLAQAPPGQAGKETTRATPRQTPPATSRQPVPPTNPFGPFTTPTPTPPPTPGQGCAGCASCGACAGASMLMIILPIVIMVAIIVLNVCLLIWVSKDAKARGMDNAVMWVVLVAFTGLVGLIVYIASRTQGNLVACHECGNQRLEVSRRCPHCGQA